MVKPFSQRCLNPKASRSRLVVLLSLLVFGIALLTTALPARAAAASLSLTAEEQAYLDSRPYLSVLALETFPPFSYSDNGLLKGYSLDYMRLMSELLDKEVRFVSGVRWFEALQMLEEGELDIIPAIAETEERRTRLDFTPYKHIEYTSAAVFHRDLSGIPLSNQIIAVAKNTFLHTYLKKHYPEITLLVTATTNEAVLAVANGRADIAVGSYPSLNFYIEKHWLSQMTSGQVPGLELPVETALPMGIKKGRDLLKSILIKAEAAISFDQVSQLRERWMRGVHRSDSIVGLTADEVRFLNQHRNLTLCVDPDWMPLEGVRDGRHVGISADLMALVSERLSVNFTFAETRSWLQTLQLAREGKCDLFPLIMKTEARGDFLNFTQPLIESPLVLITGIDTPYLPKLEGLKAKRIGIVKGYAFNDLLKKQYPELDFVEVGSVAQGLTDVREGRLFGHIDSLITSGFWIQKHFLGQLKVSSEIDRTWQLSMGVRRELQPLDQILNKAILQIPEASRQDVVNRWVTIRYDAKHDWLITLAGILITVLVLGAVIAWYVRLNRQLEDEVTLRKQAQSAALTLARTDQLTGIMNRHGAEPLINQEMARCRRYQTPVSMMILDIDHFKRINDSMGHKAGDDALRWLCTTLSDAMRETDYLVRWGGEEFLVLLPETRLEAAGELAERYRQLIGDLSAEAVMPFTVSIGVSQLNAADSFSQWYQRTDLALYQAKNSGRNRVQVSDHQHETGPAEPSL